MSSAGPWSVKGIDPKAREIAKDLARRSGMTLGEWLNQMIIDGEPEAPPPPPLREPDYMRRPPPLQAGPQYRSEALRRSFESAYDHAAEEDLARVTRALEAFSTRIEAAEHRSTLAISGIDQSVMGVLSRLDGIERDQDSIGGRFEGSLDEVRATHAKLSDRVRRMEQEEGPRVEAMKALESALGKVAAQIYEGESRTRGSLAEVRQDLSGMSRRVDKLDAEVAGKAEAGAANPALDSVVARVNERLDIAESRTSAAMQALETSFAGLDARLRSAETRLLPEAEADKPEQRFRTLATELSQKVESSRAELASHVLAAADGKFDRMEAALRDLSSHVEKAEKQSARAIDRMGQEVMRIAQSLGHRVATVEHRSAQLTEQVGGEMTRIADAMEGRMRSSDTAQAAALEKLGGEIGKIAERLAERIAASERRAATAIDEVGDQVARVTDKINQRYDRAASELADRIRQSEERTAKLLEDARESLDRRVAETERRPLFDAPHAAAPAPASAFQTPAAIEELDDEPPALLAPKALYEEEDERPLPMGPLGAFHDDPFAATDAAGFDDDPIFEADPEPAHEPQAVLARPVEAAPALVPVVEAATFEDFDEPPEVAHQAEFESEPPPLPESVFEPLPPEADHFGPPPVQPAARSSTRELIEAARAAAKQASAAEGRGRRRPIDEMFQGSTPAPALEPEAAPKGLGAFLSRKKKKKESGTVVRTALLASVTAAALTASVVGYNMLASNRADRAAPATPDAPVAPRGQQTAAKASDADLLAAALMPEPTTAPSPAPAVDGAPTEPDSAPAVTPDLVAPPPRLKPAPAARPAPAAKPVPASAPAVAAAADASADLKQVYASAVRQIVAGDATGVDPLRKAANQGYAPAQFYLAKLFESGSSGVKKDPVEARRWTERAAAGGDPKAMHNLGLYYFEGTGGAKNAAAAASWFQRAAAAGLQDSQYNLARLYEQGYGVPQNTAEAFKWYLIAGSTGDAEAKSSAERLRAQLPADSRDTAQKAATGFKPLITTFAAK